MKKEDWAQLPKSRSEAKASGAKYYFTGEPCKHGHIAPRKTRGVCVECKEVEWRQRGESRAGYFRSYNDSPAGKAAKKRYYAANKELVKFRAKKVDPEAKKLHQAKWRATHAAYRLVDNQMYKRRIRHCTPVWLTAEEREQIKEIYRSAMEMTKLTGEKYTVDHQVPLRSKVVSGLHVPWNLRIMPHADNSRKGNRLEV